MGSNSPASGPTIREDHPCWILTACLPAATFAVMLSLCVGTGAAVAQDKSQQPGCTTSNGVSTGAGCKTGETGSAAGAVENGMPASKHQQEVLRTDDKATKGQNMSTTG